MFSLQVKDQKPPRPESHHSSGIFHPVLCILDAGQRPETTGAHLRPESRCSSCVFYPVLCILAAGQRPETTSTHQRPESSCREGGGRGRGGRGGSAGGDGGAGRGASHRHQVRHFTLQLGSVQFRVVSVCSGKSIGTLPHFS